MGAAGSGLQWQSQEEKEREKINVLSETEYEGDNGREYES